MYVWLKAVRAKLMDKDLGPDERDRDLLDGSWEDSYYKGDVKQRDWHAIYVGIAIVVLAAILLPLAGIVLR